MNIPHSRGQWQTAKPCPICRKAGWCRISANGALAGCRHVEAGAWKTKTDKNGAPIYLHRLDGTTRPDPPSGPHDGPAVERAGPDTLHAVYDAMLAGLPLSQAHRDGLRKRGLTDSEIDRRLYRTLPSDARARVRVAGELAERWPDAVLSVPGIVRHERDGRRYLSIAGNGLLVPVRDLAGRIVAAKVRRDDPLPPDAQRYYYLSSVKSGGPGPGSPAHVPLGTTGPCPCVRLTEGELKADVTYLLSKTPTISTPGVGNWRVCLPVLKELQAQTVIVSFDSDAATKPHVARALSDCCEELVASKYGVRLERWGTEHKGIDDALAAGVAVEILAAPARIGPALPPHMTDQGNASRMVAAFGASFRHCHPWDKSLVWDGKRWRLDDTAEVERFAKETVRCMYAEGAAAVDEATRKALVTHALRSESAGRLAAMIRLARSEPGISVLPQELDRDPWLLNCPNGCLDLRTGRLRQHDRKDLVTKLSPTPFEAKAVCPTWERFLLDVFAGDAELVGYVQRLAGYALTGDVREQKLPVFWGAGGNGKTTLINAILEVIGDNYGMSAPADFLLAKHGEQHPTGLADLLGKRLVVTSETGKGRRLNEALVKSLTGGDRIRARRMREDYWEFAPSHKVLLVTNNRPEVRGTDHGIWRRVQLVPFTVTFPEGRQDKDLPARLRGEAAGILAWMVRGALEWKAAGLRPPASVLAATADFRSEEDAIGAFLAEACRTGSESFRCKASALYQRFRGWVSDSGEKGGLADLSQRRFGAEMTARGFKRKDSNGVWYFGVAIREEESELPD
jgi:putative DNA primase/helicase